MYLLWFFAEKETYIHWIFYSFFLIFYKGILFYLLLIFCLFSEIIFQDLRRSFKLYQTTINCICFMRTQLIRTTKNPFASILKQRAYRRLSKRLMVDSDNIYLKQVEYAVYRVLNELYKFTNNKKWNIFGAWHCCDNLFFL